MKRNFLILLLCFFAQNYSYAQYQVSGKIVDSRNEPLLFANIALFVSSDSSFVSGVISDETGQFLLEIKDKGTYYVRVSSIGFNTFISNSFAVNIQQLTKNLDTITLLEGGLELSEVEVVASRPIFEQRIDRTIINLENRVVTTGTSALEVLEQSPGVNVNRSSGAIGMLGKEGVNVMINGKQNYMPNDALLQFLSGLDANNIVKIELITTPPAKYDAQGNAGYINIILKKNPDEGLQGSYSLTGGYGRGVLGNSSINLNYRKGRVNLFGNYSYTHNGQEQFTTLNRKVDGFTSNLASERDPTSNNQNARLGLDYQVGKNTTIGVLFSGYLNKWDMDATNTISEIGEMETSIISQNREDNDWQHFQSNFNLVHQFKNGATLSTDVDYLYYKNENTTVYDQTFQNADEDTSFELDLLSKKITPFDILVGMVDYSIPVSEKLNISLGTKYVESNFENDVLVEEDNVSLSNFTSASILGESIFASYLEVDGQLSEKIRMKGGLRYEYTDTDLNSTNGGQVIDRQFGSFFPSLFLEYKINSTNQLNLSYSKRINRPAFSDMAPFIIFLSPNTSFGGNTALQPAIANTFQLGYQHKSVNFSFQYAKEDSTIVRFQNRFEPLTNTQIIIPDNLREQQIFIATIAFPLEVNDWWNMRFFGQYTWQLAESFVDELGIQQFKQNSFMLNGSQSFKLSQDFNLELSGFYQTASLDGNVQFKPQGVLNFGIQKKLNNNARLTFNINDIFNSLKVIGITDLQEENIFVRRTFDFSQRTFRLTYSATFGNQKLKKNRNRNSGGDEKNRVN